MASPPRKSKPTASASEYTVLARRYRPQQFADLVGQEATAQALVNALKSNRVAHAYLFTGARGVGKTSAARILAKALNCERGPTVNPCDQCEACQAIAAGEDVDVLEIDGASNNKVEEVRELRQNVQYRPQRSRHKIYIIDEVHMLTTSAFNALLKTLEEPPPHVKFIFATTEVQRIPVTILSRCQRFDFSGIASRQIEERLAAIAKAEKVQAEPEALALIARRAAGSMRDAQSLLDQLMAFGGGRLTAEQVHHLLGTAHEEQVAELAAAVLKGDLTTALGMVHQFAEKGGQLGELLDQLLEYWRDLLIIQSAGKDFAGLSFSRRFIEEMASQAGALPPDAVLAGLDVLAAAKARMRGSSHARVLLEMALVRLSKLRDLLPLADLVRMVQGGEVNGPKEAGGPRPAPPLLAPAGQESKKNSIVKVGNDQAANEPEAAIPLGSETLDLILDRAMSFVGTIHGSELAGAKERAISGPNCLVLRFPAEYSKQKEFCEDTARNQRFVEALRRTTGQEISVRYELLPGEAAAVEEPRIPRTQQLRAAAQADPLVKRLMDELGAQVLAIDNGFGTTTAAVSAGDSEEAAHDA